MRALRSQIGHGLSMPKRPSNIDCRVDVTSKPAHRQRDKNNTRTKNKVQKKWITKRRKRRASKGEDNSAKIIKSGPADRHIRWTKENLNKNNCLSILLLTIIKTPKLYKYSRKNL